MGNVEPTVSWIGQVRFPEPKPTLPIHFAPPNLGLLASSDTSSPPSAIHRNRKPTNLPAMKRKKWSELEELTLLTKYSELLNSGTLSKLKTREKKFKPIADHVNSVHHLQDPTNFPFRWSWRDVSIKVQNMRHQYLGVKQKIRLSDGEFNWDDGVDHWENFLKYKEVFGDVELEVKGKKFEEEDILGSSYFDRDDDLGFGFEMDTDEDDDLVGSDGEFGSEIGDLGFVGGKRLKKGIGGSWSKVLDLRELVVKREGRRREMDWNKEDSLLEREYLNIEKEMQKERKRGERDDSMEMRELELDEMEMRWARRGFARISRLERELDDERKRRLKLEEKWEEEEMEWRERMVGLQVEHEKQMMQMHAEASQNQMQILGVMARLVCQFYGSAHDGLGGGLGALPPQVLQNLQHPVDLGDTGKPDANSPSEFM